MIPPCLRCGYDEGTYVHAQARGPAQISFNSDGEELETHYDSLFFIRSHIVRCEGCLKIRRDLEYKGSKVRVKE